MHQIEDLLVRTGIIPHRYSNNGKEVKDPGNDFQDSDNIGQGQGLSNVGQEITN